MENINILDINSYIEDINDNNLKDFLNKLSNEEQLLYDAINVETNLLNKRFSEPRMSVIINNQMMSLLKDFKKKNLSFVNGSSLGKLVLKHLIDEEIYAIKAIYLVINNAERPSLNAFEKNRYFKLLNKRSIKNKLSQYEKQNELVREIYKIATKSLDSYSFKDTIAGLAFKDFIDGVNSDTPTEALIARFAYQTHQLKELGYIDEINDLMDKINTFKDFYNNSSNRAIKK